MRRLHLIGFAALAASLAVLVPQRECAAASKDECVDAHSRGQDLREKGQLSRARQTFLTCAQSSCPPLIQGDCARFGEDLTHLLPSVTFGARDSKATDLPNTSVYVDDQLVATRLDDGKSYDLDPGKHTIRFWHEGKETSLKVILNQGEKGRVLVGTFMESTSLTAPPPRPTADVGVTDTYPSSRPPSRSILPLLVAGVGSAALVTGATLFAFGLRKVPANCTVSSRECAAPPGDASLESARGGVSLANIGATVGIGGASLLVGGLAWYFAQASPESTRQGRLVQPPVQAWIGRDSGGVAVSRSF